MAMLLSCLDSRCFVNRLVDPKEWIGDGGYYPQTQEELKEDDNDLFDAIVIGLADYCRKSTFQH